MAKRLHRLLITATMLGTAAGTVSAACLPAKGKILSNGQFGGSTLGVVALVLGAEKTKCAIVGVPQFPAPPDFKHTVVCESTTGQSGVQDQITFNSTLDHDPVVTEMCTTGAPGVQAAFTFEETSMADPSTGRGRFEGATGQLSISGSFNCQGGIRMQFSGTICLPD